MKKKHAGMGVAELRRLKQLENENRRLKRLVADLTLDKQMLHRMPYQKSSEACLKRQLRPLAAEKNECWSMDFMSDELFDGRRIRLLTIVDHHTRESLAIHVGQRIRGCEVVEVLERVMKDHGRPRTIRVDNGPEFISKDVDLWAYWNHVTLDFSRPGKPTDNAYIESFNGRFRRECLNEHWFLSLDDARDRVEAWRQDYNKQRPHIALGNATPEEYAARVEPQMGPSGLDLEASKNGLAYLKSC